MLAKQLRNLRAGHVAVIAAIAMAAVSMAEAKEMLPMPDGRAVLQITGQIEKTNEDDAANFDLALLEKIGVSELQTSTPWTDGRPVFTGILMSDLIEYVGGRGDTIVATALNDYAIEIPMSDFRKYPVLIAFAMDGKRFKVRDKGPLWIIYPQDDFEELQNKKTQSKWIWQIKSLHVK